MGDEWVKHEAMQIMGLFQVLPRLVVFDLDYTLWPYYCHRRSRREMPTMYPQAKGILQALKAKGILVVIASRCPTPDIANTFLDKLGINTIFLGKEIFPSFNPKTEHFQKIHRKTGIPYTSMLFFDDENRNIEAISKMGVTSILVNRGVNLDALQQGLTKYLRSQCQNYPRFQNCQNRQHCHKFQNCQNRQNCQNCLKFPNQNDRCPRPPMCQRPMNFPNQMCQRGLNCQKCRNFPC